MRAVVATRFGGPDVLEVLDLPEPTVGPGQVKVDVVTAGLNPVDAMMRRGEMGGQAPLRLGTELVGRITEIGPGVTGFTVGEEIIGFGALGSYAETHVLPATQIAPKPAPLDWNVAGGLSGVGQTALTVLDTLALTPGQTLLAHGATGGVGSLLVQLAHRAGIHVIGTASPANHDYLRRLGATPVAYGPGLADRLRTALREGDHPGIDAAVDMSGVWDNIESTLELVPLNRTITLVPATAQRSVPLVRVQRSAARLTHLAALAATGELHAEVQETFPLDDIVRAHTQLDTKHTRGKLVLRIREA
ncbi:NADP-dependent oxidoreductase [Nocardioides yefusunii]|uniref:NADP-dependent oxidoreductase n=1 Tax=Nocardioides yefusunii TaxID=2500546 RepID=A0ABW1QX21_9ACTN|nr:NADP-dependent oxidoreductase [Nocardioides yefusunii]